MGLAQSLSEYSSPGTSFTTCIMSSRKHWFSETYWQPLSPQMVHWISVWGMCSQVLPWPTASSQRVFNGPGPKWKCPLPRWEVRS